MKTKLFLAMLIAVSAFAGHQLIADDASGEAEFAATCPLSGGPAKEAVTASLLGKNVHFCCENCQKAFASKKDSKEVMQKVMLQLVETGQAVQTGCPMSGNKVNAETLVSVGNAEVGFCCKNCQGKFKNASEEDQLAMLFGNASKGFTLQTACPISGKPIDVAKKTEHDGKDVYLCCPGCEKAFQADPAKYLAKLPQFQKK